MPREKGCPLLSEQKKFSCKRIENTLQVTKFVCPAKGGACDTNAMEKKSFDLDRRPSNADCIRLWLCPCQPRPSGFRDGPKGRSRRYRRCKACSVQCRSSGISGRDCSRQGRASSILGKLCGIESQHGGIKGRGVGIEGRVGSRQGRTGSSQGRSDL